MNNIATFAPIMVGDQRPVVVVVVPSDGALLTSATYTIVRRRDSPGVIFDTGGPCTVTPAAAPLQSGIVIATPNLITFPTVDIYTVNFALRWADGVIDHTVSAIISVQPLPR